MWYLDWKEDKFIALYREREWKTEAECVMGLVSGRGDARVEGKYDFSDKIVSWLSTWSLAHSSPPLLYSTAFSPPPPILLFFSLPLLWAVRVWREVTDYLTDYLIRSLPDSLTHSLAQSFKKKQLWWRRTARETKCEGLLPLPLHFLLLSLKLSCYCCCLYKVRYGHINAHEKTKKIL